MNMQKLSELAGEISEPLIVIVPSVELPIEDFGRLYNSVQSLLDKISDRLNIDLKILIESAAYFDGYDTIGEIIDEQEEDVPF